MTPQSSPTNKLSPARWGCIVTPENWGNTIPDGFSWCFDNQVFSGKFNEKAFWKKLKKMKKYRKSCKFVVAPDVVGNAIATMEAFRYWGCRIKAAGWPVAFVAQDGQELYPFPTEFDALFLGGRKTEDPKDEWKRSEAAINCVRRAKALGKWTHAGRVNSQKLIWHFDRVGVDSVDGTSICHAPDKNYKVLERALIQPAFTLL